MKKIKLTQGKYALVDDEDFYRLSIYRWFYHHTGYAYRREGYPNRKHIQLHQMVLSPRKGLITDHINQDKLDCRRENLRYCTRKQNTQNVGVRSNNTTGFTGVFFMKRINRYVAGIGRPRKYLGCYKTKEEAALAYNKAAIKRFGEFACLNKV